MKFSKYVLALSALLLSLTIAEEKDHSATQDVQVEQQETDKQESGKPAAKKGNKLDMNVGFDSAVEDESSEYTEGNSFVFFMGVQGSMDHYFGLPSLNIGFGYGDTVHYGLQVGLGYLLSLTKSDMNAKNGFSIAPALFVGLKSEESHSLNLLAGCNIIFIEGKDKFQGFFVGLSAKYALNQQIYFVIGSELAILTASAKNGPKSSKETVLESRATIGVEVALS